MGSLKDAVLRGFLVPSPRTICATIDDTETAFTEAGPRPGSPVAQNDTSRAKPALSGTQSSAGVDLAFVAAGFPGTDPDASSRAAWRVDGEADTEWRGWSPPSLLHSSDMITPFSSSTLWPNHDCVTIPSTQVVIATTGKKGGATLTGFESYSLSPVDWTWTSNGDVRPLSNDVAARDNCLLILPDETVLAFELTQVGGTLFHRWTAYETTDVGVSWTVYADKIIPDSVAASFAHANNSRMAAAMAGLNVLMVRTADSGTQEFDQFASNSLGTRFTQVGSRWDAADAPQMISLKTLPGGRVGLCYYDGTDVRFKSVGSAYESLQAATSVVIAAGVTPEATAMWSDSGALWVMFDDDGVNRLFLSLDDGVTWSDAGADPRYRAPWNSGDSNTKLLSAAATTSMGRAIVLGQGRDGGGGTTYDGMVWAVQYGGWSNVEPLGLHDPVTGFGSTWLPVELQGTISGWASNGTGPADVLESPGRTLLSTTGNTRYYTHTSVWGTTIHDMIGLYEVDVVSGGNIGLVQVGIQGSQGDGVNRRTFQVVHTKSQYAVESNGTARGTVTHNIPGRLQVLWYFNASTDKFSTWYRDKESAGNFVKGHDKVDITPFGSGSSGSYEYGHRSSSATVSRWYGHSLLWSTTQGSLEPPDALVDLVGKTLSALPYPINEAGEDPKAAFLSATTGPAKRLELWDIDAVHDYARDNLCWDKEPSPSKTWRSLGDAPDGQALVPEEIPLAWDLGNLTRLGSESIALGVFNTNVQELVLEGDAGAGFVAIGTWDASFEFTFTRVGDIVTAAPGTAAERYFWRGELDGAFVQLGGATFRRRAIRHQTEGVFDGNITTKQAALYISDLDGAELSSGTAIVYPRNGVLVVHDPGEFDRYRIQIPAGLTNNGYYFAGTIVLGGLAVAGKQWSSGWSWQREPNAETNTDRGGTRRSRQTGPAPKSLTIAWPDGVHQKQIRAGNPDYLASDSGTPIAARDDVAWWLMGLMEELKSGQTPVVLLNSIPKASGGTISDPSKFLFANITSTVGMENMNGDEDTTDGRADSFRVPSVNFREVV